MGSSTLSFLASGHPNQVMHDLRHGLAHAFQALWRVQMHDRPDSSRGGSGQGGILPPFSRYLQRESCSQ